MYLSTTGRVRAQMSPAPGRRLSKPNGPVRGRRTVASMTEHVALQEP